MTTQDLFRCIGDLSDTMIEEAADIRRKKCWLPIAALAACAPERAERAADGRLVAAVAHARPSLREKAVRGDE